MTNLPQLGALLFAAVMTSNCSAVSRANKNAYVREFSVGLGLIIVEKVSGDIFPFFQRCPINVTCLEGGRRRPAAGFAWVNKSDPHNLQVKWTAGLTHPKYSHIVAFEEENFWVPESGFKWSTGALSDHRQESENLEVEVEKNNDLNQTQKQLPAFPPRIRPGRLGPLSLRPLVVPSAPEISLPSPDKGAPDTFATLTEKDPQARIDYRDGPGDQAYRIHYGLVGDRVKILESTPMADGYTWFNVLYPPTGARGWIRGDYVKVEN